MSDIITRAEREMRKQLPEDQVLPSRWEMVKNLVQAAADAAKGGFDVRGPEETEAALKICAACPHLIENEGNPRCAKCGCFLGSQNKLGKVSLKSWRCPLDKW